MYIPSLKELKINSERENKDINFNILKQRATEILIK